MYPLLKLVLTDMHNKVQEFNRPLHLEKSDIPMVLELLREESKEFTDAVYPELHPIHVQVMRIAEGIDGVCDMLYVLLNYVYMCNKYKVNVEDSTNACAVIAQLTHELNPAIVFCFDIIHESNMSKQVDGVFLINHPDRPWFNEYLPTGKVIKPDTYIKVDQLKLLQTYIDYTDPIPPYDRLLIGDECEQISSYKLAEECSATTYEQLLSLLKEVCV
jgi:hypothetical protein